MKLEISNKKGVDIQSDMFGIFFEDINYGADGGIYAEIIENRSFEFVEATGDKDDYHQRFDGMYGWEAWGAADLFVNDENPENPINPHYLSVVAKQGAGFTNKAYDGVFVVAEDTYKLELYARSSDNAVLEVGVLTTDGSFIKMTEICIDSTSWKHYKITGIRAIETIRHGLFAVRFKDGGSADFDMISLFPENAVCGLFRRDLALLLEGLKPGFIRFPGGCVVEGNELANRYQWKNSIGEINKRKSNWNRWAVHENSEKNNFTSIYSHYNQTLGLGYYEYFILCEYLGAKALPVASVGLACQYQSSEKVGRGTQEYQEYIQDVLDLIEFANGDVSTKWGKVRADMGHPASFNLEMIGIGNEQWESETVDFFDRYADFERAIHEKYPDMKLIGSAGPTVFTPTYEAAWKDLRQRAKTNPRYTYAVDEHYYMAPDWFLDNTHFYDEYPRDVKVFAGEYASHINIYRDSSLTSCRCCPPSSFKYMTVEESPLEQRNNWWSALCEAAFLTGIERNADVVYLASYAPLFARIGYTQWSPDMIWFDDVASFGTPNYYVQKLYSTCTGSQTLVSTLEGGDESRVYQSVSRDKEKIYIKLVNASDKACEIDISGISDTRATKITLCGNEEDTNSLSNPKKVAPVTEEIGFTSKLTLQPQSFVVLIAS